MNEEKEPIVESVVHREENRLLLWLVLAFLGVIIFVGGAWLTSERSILLANDAEAKTEIQALKAHEQLDITKFNAVAADIFIICGKISAECIPIPADGGQ